MREADLKFREKDRVGVCNLFLQTYKQEGFVINPLDDDGLVEVGGIVYNESRFYEPESLILLPRGRKSEVQAQMAALQKELDEIEKETATTFTGLEGAVIEARDLGSFVEVSRVYHEDSRIVYANFEKEDWPNIQRIVENAIKGE